MRLTINKHRLINYCGLILQKTPSFFSLNKKGDNSYYLLYIYGLVGIILCYAFPRQFLKW